MESQLRNVEKNLYMVECIFQGVESILEQNKDCPYLEGHLIARLVLLTE